MLDGCVIVAHQFCFILRADDDFIQRTGKIHLYVSGYLNLLLNDLLGALLQEFRVDRHLLEKLRDQTVFLCKQRQQEVLLLDLLVSVFVRQLFALLNGLGRLLCESADIHIRHLLSLSDLPPRDVPLPFLQISTLRLRVLIPTKVLLHFDRNVKSLFLLFWVFFA